MTLLTGVRLGSYEIRGPIGAGGMGEVYRAWDERLGREVAIKVLPESVATDPDRLRRFDQEARAAGALNHPNVLAVHDVGSHGSLPYIVSELLDGETLRRRLQAGGLTPRKTIEHAIQIARGLSAAHQRGIVHRDLKPENIFLTRDGQVKILDFGLAKLRDLTGSDPERDTATQQTRPGAVMGTVPYMSPEQVRGLPADARSDIFALGSVLYEMLAGRRAFVGGTASEIETAILREEPPELPTLDAHIPVSLDRIVRRCLEKRAEDRFETARDVAFALDTVGTAEAVTPIQDRVRAWRGPVILALSALVAGLLVGGAMIARFQKPPPPPSYTQLTFRRGAILSARFSHDGQTVVYSAAWDGQPAQLYTTRIGSHESRPLGLEGMVLSVSSRDEVAVKLGRFLGRRSWGLDDKGTLARVSLAGGAPRELLENVTAADWDRDGRELAVLHEGRLEFPIGHVVYAPEGALYSVRVLAGGRFAILEEQPIPEGETWRFAVSLIDREGKRTVLSPGWLNWRDLSWSEARQELFFAGSRGDEFGLHSVSLTGREHLVTRIPGDFALHDVDAQGRLLLERRVGRYSTVCLPPGESRERDLSWLDGTGAVDLSADGRELLLVEYGGSPATQTLYLRKTDGSPAVRLSEDNGRSLSPDGRWVLALPGQQAAPDHLVLVPTRAGERRELRDGSLHALEGGAWFPGGKRIVVVTGEEGYPSRLFVWDADMSAPPRPLPLKGRLGAPVVSPDGRAVAVHVAGNGVMLNPVDGGPARPVRGGSPKDEPLRWSGDGRWLYVLRESGVAGPRDVWGQRGITAWIDRLEIATGTRQPWRELAPADPTGVFAINSVQITPDGNSYAYSFVSSIGSLYLAEGLR